MKRVTIALALLSCCLIMSAQDKQYGYGETTDNSFSARVGATIGYKPVKQLDLSLSQELRAGAAPNIKGFDCSRTSLDITYTPVKRLDIIASYTFTAKLRKENARLSHRGNFGLAYTFKMGDFRLQLREMVLCSYRMDSVNVKEKANPLLKLRSRLKLTYKVPSVPVNPYVLFELFNTLNEPFVDASDPANVTKEFRKANEAAGIAVKPFRNYISDYRAEAGVKYEFNSHTAIKAYYLFDNKMKYDVNYGKNSGKINRITYATDRRHSVGISIIHYF